MRFELHLQIRGDEVLESHPSWHADALRELTELSGHCRCSRWLLDRSSRMSVDVTTPEAALRETQVHGLAGAVVIFGTDVSIDPLAARMADQSIAGDLAVSVVTSDLESSVEAVWLAIQIAMPGGLVAMNGTMLVDGEVYGRMTRLGPSIGDGIDTASRMAWPPINALSIRRCYDWLSAVPGFDERVGRGQVGRAVAALSHLLLHEPPIPADLIWAMMGLEALYGRDQGPVGSQLLEKAEIWLGSRRSHKQQLKNAYRVRSKLIHGEIDLPFFESDAGGDAYDRFLNEHDSASQLSTVVLLASIQELVRRNQHQLKFAYRLADAT